MEIYAWSIIWNFFDLTQEAWCAKITLKLQNIQKTLRKQFFFCLFFINFKDILKFVQIWLNISSNRDQFHMYKNFSGLFDIPGTPGGASI